MTLWPDAAWARQALPARPPSAHKGSFGTLAVVAGSLRYRGAALLATEGALRCGTGLVRLCSIEEVCAAAAVRLPAATLLPLPRAEGGIAPEAAGAVLAEKQTALLAGCGLGNTAATAALCLRLLKEATCPLVQDADALNALAGHLAAGEDADTARQLHAALDAAAQPVVLTPHPGELARLCGLPAARVMEDPAAAAHRYADAHGCVVVAKGHATHVAAPGGDAYTIDLGGNAGLAKAGSGDVLAGVIAGLLAQGMAAPKAAAAGVWLHAEAGRIAAARYGSAGLSPMELPLAVGAVMKDLAR